MGKKSVGSIPQKHVHSRLSYLHQAASYLANKQSVQQQDRSDRNSVCASKNIDNGSSSSPQQRHLVSHLRGVSRKSVIRLTSEVKHSICKRCDIILVPGQTSQLVLENSSRHEAKPWAEVLVIRCNACGTAKRFPVGAPSTKTSHPSVSKPHKKSRIT